MAGSDISILKEMIIKTLKDTKPSHIIVYGDTNSSMAASLAAQELGSKLIHVEAGVRDFDLAVPEEGIRIKIDAMSDYLLPPSDFCKMCLKYRAGTRINRRYWKLDSRCMQKTLESCNQTQELGASP